MLKLRQLLSEITNMTVATPGFQLQYTYHVLKEMLRRCHLLQQYLIAHQRVKIIVKIIVSRCAVILKVNNNEVL